MARILLTDECSRAKEPQLEQLTRMAGLPRPGRPLRQVIKIKRPSAIHRVVTKADNVARIR